MLFGLGSCASSRGHDSAQSEVSFMFSGWSFGEQGRVQRERTSVAGEDPGMDKTLVVDGAAVIRQDHHNDDDGEKHRLFHCTAHPHLRRGAETERRVYPREQARAQDAQGGCFEAGRRRGTRIAKSEDRKPDRLQCMFSSWLKSSCTIT